MPQKSSSTTESGGGVVEISNVRRSFYSAGCAAPDMFFGWLVSAARDACRLGQSTQADSGASALGSASRMAETYLAGLLLCDENFIPATVQRSSDHHYLLDFHEGTIRLRTQIYLASKIAASYFTIHIRGKILESTFEVRNAVTERVLARVTEDEIQKPEFFSQELAFLCFHSQKDATIAAQTDDDDLFDQAIEMRVEICVAGEPRMVTVSKGKREGLGQARDETSGALLCSVPTRYFRNLCLLIDALPALIVAGSVNSMTPAPPLAAARITAGILTVCATLLAAWLQCEPFLAQAAS